MLPLFLLCTHSDDLLHAALFQCALFQPTRAGHPETCVCGLYLRMGEAAVGLRELSQDPDERVVSPEMKEAHNGNLAAVLFWCLLFLLAQTADNRLLQRSLFLLLAPPIPTASTTAHSPRCTQIIS